MKRNSQNYETNLQDDNKNLLIVCNEFEYLFCYFFPFLFRFFLLQMNVNKTINDICRCVSYAECIKSKRKTYKNKLENDDKIRKANSCVYKMNTTNKYTFGGRF